MPLKRIETEFFELRTKVASMAMMVSSMFDDVTKAMLEQNIELASDVYRRDALVDALDIKLDEHCLRILALYDPKAAELRYVVTVLRLIVDLERIGDHCKVIAKQVKKHHLSNIVQETLLIREMVEMTRECLRMSVEGFFEQDIEKVEKAIHMAVEVDAHQGKSIREMLTFISESAEHVRLGVSMINVVRRIARIADHAQNVCEMVYYVIDGTNIRIKHEDVRKK